MLSLLSVLSRAFFLFPPWSNLNSKTWPSGVAFCFGAATAWAVGTRIPGRRSGRGAQVPLLSACSLVSNSSTAVRMQAKGVHDVGSGVLLWGPAHSPDSKKFWNTAGNAGAEKWVPGRMPFLCRDLLLCLLRGSFWSKKNRTVKRNRAAC